MRQFVIFLINGGVLGIIAWAIQMQLYVYIGADGLVSYGIAAAFTCFPLMLLNCAIQRYFIFKTDGHFSRFFLANIFVMWLVSITSPGFKHVIDLLVGPPYGDQGGFVVASLFGAIPSFLLNKYWVFSPRIRRRLPNIG